MITNIEQPRAHGIWPDDEKARPALLGVDIYFQDVVAANKEAVIFTRFPSFLSDWWQDSSTQGTIVHIGAVRSGPTTG